MYSTVRRFANDRAGVTLIEYGLIAILIGVAFVATIGSIGTNVTTLFTSVSTSI
ncbi:Flp family type IVb pilin [Emcibacter sp. SYSU 3D8]|uniref:Flp family type IVb pilin n=1 Tax=Emcibacter sp. SYSU 3D8 TaxID=3133969 RepID=UPI0031FE4BFC